MGPTHQPRQEAEQGEAEVLKSATRQWGVQTGEVYGTSARACQPTSAKVPAGAGTYSSRDMRRRNLPDFLETTVATVVKPMER